jgi:hypothetical protein
MVNAIRGLTIESSCNPVFKDRGAWHQTWSGSERGAGFNQPPFACQPFFFPADSFFSLTRLSGWGADSTQRFELVNRFSFRLTLFFSLTRLSGWGADSTQRFELVNRFSFRLTLFFCFASAYRAEAPRLRSVTLNEMFSDIIGPRALLDCDADVHTSKRYALCRYRVAAASLPAARRRNLLAALAKSKAFFGGRSLFWIPGICGSF